MNDKNSDSSKNALSLHGGTLWTHHPKFPSEEYGVTDGGVSCDGCRGWAKWGRAAKNELAARQVSGFLVSLNAYRTKRRTIILLTI